MPDWDDNWITWIVIVVGQDLRIDDIVEPPNMQIYRDAHAKDDYGRAVAGGYYVWKEESGDLVAYGVIEEATSNGRFTRAHLETIGEDIGVSDLLGSIQQQPTR